MRQGRYLGWRSPPTTSPATDECAVKADRGCCAGSCSPVDASATAENAHAPAADDQETNNAHPFASVRLGRPVAGSWVHCIRVKDLRRFVTESLTSAMLPVRYSLSSAFTTRASLLRSFGDGGDAPHHDGASSDEVEWFSAWLWDPRFAMHIRGWSTVRLGVRPRGLTIAPGQVETLLHGWRAPIEYDWPVAVLERLLPFASRGLLVDVQGQAGLCIVHRVEALREALARAGVSVIEIRRWGWDMPRRIRLEELGTHHQDELPPSIVRAD